MARPQTVSTIAKEMANNTFSSAAPGKSPVRVVYALTVMLSLSLSAPAQAADVAFNAYLGISLDGSSSFFGASCGVDRVAPFDVDNDFERPPRPALDLRYSADRGTVLFLNGIPLRSPLARHSSDGDERANDNKNEIDWTMVAAVLVGAGLIALVATADETKVQACSGPNCPPPDRPPPAESEPAASAEGQ